MTEAAPRSDDAVIVLFTRGDEEVRHKRLGPDATTAGRVCRALLCRALDTIGSVSSRIPVVVLSEAPLASDDAARLGARRVLHLPQRGAAFEDRLLDGLRRVAALGFGRLVLVGSDTPGLTAADLHAAVADRGPQPVVGGASDGGIYLLAADATRLEELRGLPWCTDSLCRALLARLSGRLLPTRRPDIDGAADVATHRRLLERICRDSLGCDLGAPGAERPWPAPDAAASDALPAVPPGRAPPQR